MIKHAEGRYLSSELTMHFGLIPRTNRGIFCINELPDLAAKIQVGLFNVLEERDVQIRGYPVRLDLDLCMVFSANPEDYTNRGRIVTPLKDRIGSVVRTHYPLTRELGIAISDQNAWLDRDGAGQRLAIPSFIKEIVEEISRLARTSSHVNQQSGVSVRMSIANLENVVSNAERRGLLNGESPDRAAGQRPRAPGRQLARQARADDDRGRRPRRQADRADRRRGGQERLRRSTSTPKQFRADWSNTSSGARGSRSATRCRRRDVLDRIEQGAGLRKRAESCASQVQPELQPHARRPRRRRRQRGRVHPRRAARQESLEQECARRARRYSNARAEPDASGSALLPWDFFLFASPVPVYGHLSCFAPTHVSNEARCPWNGLFSASSPRWRTRCGAVGLSWRWNPRSSPMACRGRKIWRRHGPPRQRCGRRGPSRRPSPSGKAGRPSA